MGERKHVCASLVDAIQHIPVPAFVVSMWDAVLAMNTPGHAWLVADPARSDALLRDSGPDPEVFCVTTSSDRQSAHALAVLREKMTTSTRSEVPACWGLSPHERELAARLARGATNAQIARERACSERTVERYIRSIVNKAISAARFSLCTVDDLLEAIARPAVVLGTCGDIEYANSAARRWLDLDPAAAMAALATRHDPSTSVQVVPFAVGDARGEVVIVSDAADVEARLAVASRRWSLTPRQAQVLEQLSKGLSNARIARQLGCAEATVEIHVSRILQRAEVDSRASLLASLLWGP